jgi:hypothetical protein
LLVTEALVASHGHRISKPRLLLEHMQIASACKKRMAEVSRNMDGQMGFVVNPARWLSR